MHFPTGCATLAGKQGKTCRWQGEECQLSAFCIWNLWPRQSGHELLCRKSFETELWQGHSVGFGSRTWPAPHPSVHKSSKAPSEIFMRVATIMPSPEQRGQMPRVMQMQHKSCKFKGNTALFLLSTTFALGKILYSSICYLFKTAVSTNPWLKLLE